MSSNEIIIEINKILSSYSTQFENLLNKKDKKNLLSLCDSINNEIKEILDK